MARKRRNNREKRETPPRDRRDYGTPELRLKIAEAHHGRVPIVQEGNEKHVRNYAQVPVDFYFRTGVIDRRQWEAAGKLYRLWYYGAQKSNYVMMNLLRIDGKDPDADGGDVSAERYRDAMNALGETFTQLAVYNVVCIGEWAKYLAGIPVRRRMNCLLNGLDRLADHFRIPKYQPDVNGPHEIH